MSTVGILAYGSLIEDPGDEIEPLILERRTEVETPFQIEFARSSSTRNGAPTVIPVALGGSRVRGTILVLKADVGLTRAEDLLWRRETRNEASGQHYSRPSIPKPNTVVIGCLQNCGGVDSVLYTKLDANLSDPTAAKLADLAIASARAEAGMKGRDGISYLISLKRQGVSTPLMPGYEREILKRLGASSLEEALRMCRRRPD